MTASNMPDIKFTSKKLGNKELILSPVTVLLGANGAGKSSVLREAVQGVARICPSKKAIYVEGGRAITLRNSLQLTIENVSQYGDYTLAMQAYDAKRQSSLSTRVFGALMFLERKELALKSEHSDAVQKWHSTGAVEPFPAREVPPLQRLFDNFHEIFPRLEVRYDAIKKTINVCKGTSEYSISDLSDGEKQVFSILADFVELGDDYGLVVVDEPELNLHPELAERVWSLIEAEYPDKMYLYATHSLGFAMRKQVQRVIILSDRPENIVTLVGLSDFSTIDLHQFLGSIPGVIASNKVVVTEGDEKSFDSVFYRWILGDDQIEVMPAGDCGQVLNVCRRDGIWSRIASGVALVGVVDRDFRDEPDAGAIMLRFREAESFLGVPSLAVTIDTHLAIADKRLTVDVVIDKIMDNLAAERSRICANAVAAKCGIRLGVSLTRAATKGCATVDELKQQLLDASRVELDKATTALGTEAIERVVEEIGRELDRILKDRAWCDALRYVDGKGIANAVARLIGVRSAIDLMRAVAANVSVSKIAEAQSLCSDITATLSGKTGSPTQACS